MKQLIKATFFGGCLAVLMLTGGHSLAQEQPGLRDRAEELFRRYEYANAASLYTRLVDTRKPRLNDLKRLMECYWQMHDYETAERWSARVVQHGEHGPEDVLRYATILQANGKYSDAKTQFEAYASQTGNRSDVALQLAGCDSAIVWMAEPTPHELINQTGVNTDLSEFAAIPVGDVVYFAGEPEGTTAIHGWTGRSFLRIFSARPSSSGLSDAVVVSSDFNNTPYHVGPIAASADGRTFFVTRTYPEKVETIVREDRRKYRTNRLELYIYTEKNGQWHVTPFAYNDVDRYSVGHAALSPDGRTLYFVSDMPGGKGGTDIWYTELQADGSWGQPVNAGEVINSSGDELFPAFGPDGTLYFSSDGFPGMGGLDLFASKGSKAAWSAPRNMRYPLNSPGDDFAYVVTEEAEVGIRGYLASNRKGGRGNDDIYAFVHQRPKIVIVLQGTTSDKSNNQRLGDVTVTLYDGERQIVATQQSTSNGTFEFVLDPNKNYLVLGTKEKYHSDSARISTQGITRSDTVQAALWLTPVFQVGQTFELKNIYYDFDKYNIRPDAAVILDELVQIMKEHPTLKIELSSHTDSRGSHAYNEVLSQRRAQSAVDYLVSRGIARDRMVAKGYGETRLVNHCADGVSCSREEHQANRRTEVTVLAY